MAKKLGKLDKILGLLNTEKDDSKNLLKENFKELLKRWNFSYSYRPRDSYSLQFTTRIEFNEFLSIDLLKHL